MKVAILGCGVYGLALASSFSVNDCSIVMWNKFQKEIDELKDKYQQIQFSNHMEDVIRNCDLIVIAIPVAFLENTMHELVKCYKGQNILIASKGIDIEGQMFSYEIVEKYLEKAPIGVISGGTFAKDMSDKKVMGLTLGTSFKEVEAKVRNGLASNFLKVQYIDDIVGVSVCGAIKNVMAIGFGMLDGANYPESSRFLFLTEAIYEIKNLIEELGGKSDTIMSYAGIDDIMMTCTSSQSRNYTLGKMLGEERKEEEIDEYKSKTTIEGLGTSKAIYMLAKKKNISLPISEIIYQILYEDGNVTDLIRYFLKKES